MMRISISRLIPLILFALLSLFLWRGLSLKPQELPSAQVGQSLPLFNLPILGDAKKRVTTNTLLKQPILLNVWASWCAACIDEQLFLMQLKADNTIPIYGINYKDSSDKAIEWLAKWGNPYQLVAVDKQGRLAIDLGVYGTPETFLIDSQGIIRYRHVGVLDETSWQQTLLPLVRQLQG
jgi:cytochrome c biogenesis protein CcmG/thiol:disulfide interchange protein DsbE